VPWLTVVVGLATVLWIEHQRSSQNIHTLENDRDAWKTRAEYLKAMFAALDDANSYDVEWTTDAKQLPFTIHERERPLLSDKERVLILSAARLP
jgi:hypothetical protein